MTADPWDGAESLDELVELLLDMTMDNLEEQMAADPDPGWLEQFNANRRRVEDKIRPLMIRDAERIWAGHLRREGMLI